MIKKITTIIGLLGMIMLFAPMSAVSDDIVFDTPEGGGGSGPDFGDIDIIDPFGYGDNDGYLPWDYKIDWYAVTDEEIEICEKDGGTGESREYYEYTDDDDYEVPLTVTIQAEKSEYLDPDENKIYMYEVAWYVYPSDETINYKVYLVRDSSSDEIDSGAAEVGKGSAQYIAEETSVVYSKAKITYKSSSIDLQTLMVDIVEK